VSKNIWKFFDGRDIWWWLDQDIPGILHELDAQNQVILYPLTDYSQYSYCQNALFAMLKLIKYTNLDTKDAVCLHIVHILQHRSSHPPTMSTHNMRVYATWRNIPPQLAGIYGNSAKWLTLRHDQATEGNSSLKTETVPQLGGLRGLQSKITWAAEETRAMHIVNNKHIVQLITHRVYQESAVAKNRV